MEKYFEIIEKKIKEAGYPGVLSGEEIYSDICDQIEDKENGFYLLLSKFDDHLVIEYQITINDDDFNLERFTIKSPEGNYIVELD